MDKYGDDLGHDFEGSAYLNSRMTSEYNYKEPAMYEVFILGNKEIPSEFISFITTDIFHKINMNIAQMYKSIAKGQKLLCGIYTKDVAETKIKIITDLAFENNYPLKCTIRKGRSDVIKKS